MLLFLSDLNIFVTLLCCYRYNTLAFNIVLNSCKRYKLLKVTDYQRHFKKNLQTVCDMHTYKENSLSSNLYFHSNLSSTTT